MNGLHDWSNLLIRWFHIIAGIAWIGSSFYFVWLDSSLERRPPDDESDVEGHLWMVHSGGFYRVEKKKLVPSTMPENLHWFKWEAGLTFLSGFALLIVVYYLGGGILLVDASVSDISVWGARFLGLGSLVFGWLIYDLFWISSLGKNIKLGSFISSLGLVAVAYLLTRYLSGRAAFMHVGAMMGTIMVANVWMRILPAQRALIAATTSGGTPDPKLAKRAKARSMHNNYMTLPVVFVMISNHYYGTYGHELNWLILVLIFVAGAGAQHLRNQSEHGAKWSRAVVVTLLAALCAVFILTTEDPDEIEVENQALTKQVGHAPSSTAKKEAPAQMPRDGTVKSKPLGNIHGQVVFIGKVPEAKAVNLAPGCAKKGKQTTRLQSIETNSKGALKNVFVYVSKGQENLPKDEAEKDPAIINQKGCVYEPHVLGVQLGQLVHIVNSDPILHNVRALAKNRKNKFNLAMPTQNLVIKRRFKKAETMVRLKCDVHPWMSAFVGVIEHPFFSVSNSDGQFSLQGLPEGEYTLEAWHETLGRQSKTVTVNTATVAQLRFEFKEE